MRNILRSVLLITALFFFGTVAIAATYNVYNIPEMTLNVRLTATQTTGIKFNPPKRNGVSVSIPNMSGAVFELSQGTRTEHVYASRVTVNATTKVVTLTGTVVRDLCWNNATEYTGCGGGQIFTPGAKVRLVDDARLFNLAAKKDQANTFTASGAIGFSGSGSFAPPSFATTATRDAQMGATGSPVRLACVTATGLCYFRLAGVWTAVGDTGTSNATSTTAGKVELGTVLDQTGATVTGDSGAPVVVQTQFLVGESAGAADKGKIATLSGSGLFDISTIPQIPVTKLNSGTGAGSSTFWRGDGTWSAIETLFGNAASGAVVWSANTNLNPTMEYNFSTATLNSSTTLSVSAANRPLIIKSTGNVTINGTVDLNALGGSGATATATNATGNTGVAGNSLISGYTNGAGVGGGTAAAPGAGGGGGSSYVGNGTKGDDNSTSIGGAGGTSIVDKYLDILGSIYRGVVCGGGGGSGGGGDGGTGGYGGRGGGAMVWYVGGDLTLGASSIIRANGSNGGDGSGTSGDGAGGGGGAIIIVVAGSITNGGVTVSATGGSTGGGGGANGGAAADGKVVIYSIRKGTLITN